MEFLVLRHPRVKLILPGRHAKIIGNCSSVPALQRFMCAAKPSEPRNVAFEIPNYDLAWLELSRNVERFRGGLFLRRICCCNTEL